MEASVPACQDVHEAAAASFASLMHLGLATQPVQDTLVTEACPAGHKVEVAEIDGVVAAGINLSPASSQPGSGLSLATQLSIISLEKSFNSPVWAFRSFCQSDLMGLVVEPHALPLS